MNYSAHYNRLIERARNRILDGYSERHHVIPRCMGGGNEPDNLVRLTPEEHYVAHQLLVKMNPHNRRLARAAFLMSTRRGGNKMYGWLRRLYVAVVSEQMLGNSYRMGKKPPSLTPERRARASERMLGNRHGIGNKSSLGRKLSPESIAKRTAKVKGRKQSPELIAKRAAGLMGNKNCLGRKLSPEHRARLLEANIGKPCSAEKREKIGAQQRGVKKPPRTIEHCLNIAAAKRAWWARKRATGVTLQPIIGDV